MTDERLFKTTSVAQHSPEARCWSAEVQSPRRQTVVESVTHVWQINTSSLRSQIQLKLSRNQTDTEN